MTSADLARLMVQWTTFNRAAVASGPALGGLAWVADAVWLDPRGFESQLCLSSPMDTRRVLE